MPKYQIDAYEEVFYKTVIEAQDEEEAEELFYEALGEPHPFQSNYSFEILKINKVKENQNA